MSILKLHKEVCTSIRENIESLFSKLKSIQDVSISIGIEDHIFSADDYVEFFNPKFVWSSAPENFIEYKVKKYLHNGAKNKTWRLEEKSLYMNCGIVYISHPDLNFQIEFLQEFKNEGKTLVREFTYTEGIFRKGDDDSLNLIGSSWGYGVVLSALSFKESLAFKKGIVLQMTG